MKITPARPRSPRYLSEDERIAIADLLAPGGTVRAIALALGRAPSTVSREVRRNADAHGSYRAHQAERFSRERVRGSRPRRLSEDGVLRAAIQVLLDQRCSPEQVAHELRIRFARRPWRCVCTGTIYQAIYDPAVELTRPARRRRRRRRVRGDQRRGRLSAMRMISERPADVEDRAQADIGKAI